MRQPSDQTSALVETKLERRFCVFATEGIVIAVDLSNHKLGRKAEKMIKKLHF